jgi:hypothetical protein
LLKSFPIVQRMAETLERVAAPKPSTRRSVFIFRFASTLVLWSIALGIIFSGYEIAFFALIGTLGLLSLWAVPTRYFRPGSFTALITVATVICRCSKLRSSSMMTQALRMAFWQCRLQRLGFLYPPFSSYEGISGFPDVTKYGKEICGKSRPKIDQTAFETRQRSCLSGAKTAASEKLGQGSRGKD